MIRLLALLLLAMPVAAMDAAVLCPNCLPREEGYSDVRLRPASSVPQPASDGVGAVRTSCTISHYAKDDPLLYPDQPGRAHLHMFWGNTGTDAFSTPETLRASGNGTCRGGILNRSAYWVPAVIDSTDGEVIQASTVQVYYKTGYKIGTPKNRRNEAIISLPDGLRVVTLPGKTEYEIRCAGQRLKTFADCGTDGALEILVDLPQCWDGTNLYLSDQSHMAYPRSGGCPTTHPQPIPAITYTILFPIPDGRSAANFRLSSDHGMHLGGATMHADWINGWMPGRSEMWTRDIINKGLSGGSHHAGNGEEWY